jgi:hypothetical protein
LSEAQHVHGVNLKLLKTILPSEFIDCILHNASLPCVMRDCQRGLNAQLRSGDKPNESQNYSGITDCRLRARIRRWGASAAQFVTNGGFETSPNTQSTFLNQPDTSVTGWTSTGDFVLYCTAGAGTTCDETSILGGAALAGPANGNNNGLTSSPQGGAYMAFDSDPSFHGGSPRPSLD